jgi:hypothetical protein
LGRLNINLKTIYYLYILLGVVICVTHGITPQCTCGWGGLGHLGKKTSGNQPNPWIKFLKFTGISSYTIPNAKCPVCGEAVFFYQSPNGGRVFFDELGPPWPKHGCVQTSNQPIPFQTLIHQNLTYTWQQSDWMPFIVEEVILQRPFYIISNIRGKVDENDVSLYVNSKLEVRAPYFVRPLEKERGLYEISTLINEQFSKVIHVKLFKGYTSITELAKHEQIKTTSKVVPLKTRPAKIKKPKVKKLKPTKPANKPKKTNSVIKNQKPKPTTLTAIQIAFQAAKNKT